LTNRIYWAAAAGAWSTTTIAEASVAGMPVKGNRYEQKTVTVAFERINRTAPRLSDWRPFIAGIPTQVLICTSVTSAPVGYGGQERRLRTGSVRLVA
jgi:hypothetical protein